MMHLIIFLYFQHTPPKLKWVRQIGVLWLKCDTSLEDFTLFCTWVMMNVDFWRGLNACGSENIADSVLRVQCILVWNSPRVGGGTQYATQVCCFTQNCCFGNYFQPYHDTRIHIIICINLIEKLSLLRGSSDLLVV